MATISLARFARTRGLSSAELADLVQPGHALADAVRRGPSGVPTGIDTLLGDAALAEARPPDATPPSARVRAPQAPPPTPAPSPAPQPVATPVPRPAPARHRAPEPEDEDDAGDSKAAGERWRARWARARALKLEGSLVDRGEVVREWTRGLAILRSHVMGIPSACKAALPELTTQQVDSIDAVVRAAMIAGEADRGPESESEE